MAATVAATMADTVDTVVATADLATTAMAEDLLAADLAATAKAEDLLAIMATQTIEGMMATVMAPKAPTSVTA